MNPDLNMGDPNTGALQHDGGGAVMPATNSVFGANTWAWLIIVGSMGALVALNYFFKAT